MFVSGWTSGGCGNRLRRCGRRGWRGHPLPQWLSSARLGVGPYRARAPRLGRSPALAVSQSTGGRGRHSEGSGRVWLSQTASPSPHLRRPCAGLPSLALREVLFRMATYPPPAQRGRWRVPSQPCSLTHRPMSSMLRMVRDGHGDSPITGGGGAPDTPIWGVLVGYPGSDPGPAGGKKSPKTVPTGRVIKYPKKCALFCPPGPPGPRGPNRAPRGYPPGPPLDVQKEYK